MPVTFDPAKRAKTLADRGLDFADADAVFENLLIENPDDRFDYGEERWITVGLIRDRMVVVVWTRRGEDRHIISMRPNCLSGESNDREQRRYAKQLG